MYSIYRCSLFILIASSLSANTIPPHLFHINMPNVDTNTLICAISGLGAKLPFALQLQQHETIGLDLVAHCMNELLAHNAQPLFFSTYLATNTLIAQEQQQLLKGITSGCLESNCRYAGNKIEEIQKLFPAHHYTVGGLLVGLSHPTPAREPITCGDIIIGLPTTGIHASSFCVIQSLIDSYNMDITSQAPFVTMHNSIAQTLAEPITLYTATQLSTDKFPHIKAMASVAHGGLYQAVTQTIPLHTQAKIELYRWTIPPVLRWIKQIAKLDAMQMAQKFNLGIGIVIIANPLYAKTILTALHRKNIYATAIGIIEQRSSDAPPITLVGTIGLTHSRVLIIGDTTQDHAFAWKLAQSPYIERVFITPGNGGTATENKIQNIFINTAHQGALIAYIQQNNIDLVIVTKKEPLTQGIINAFYKAGIACIGPTKKALQLITSPSFLQQHTIPLATNTMQGNSLHYAVITDGITTIPLTSCHLYKKLYDNDIGPDTDGMGACCPAPSMTPQLNNRIMQKIIQPCLDGLKAEGKPLCGFLSADIMVSSQGDPYLVKFHGDLGICTAPAILLRLQTDFFKACYAACHQQLHLLSLQWNPLPAISVMLAHTTEHQEIIVGLPESSNITKVVHADTIYKNATYSTHGAQPLCITALGETLEKARNNVYKLVQQIYWPGITYRHDIAYREITRQNR